MPDELQRSFSLPVVRVRLAAELPRPAAEISLILNRDQRQQIVQSQVRDLQDFGFDDMGGERDPQLTVPDDITSWIADWARNGLANESALWLYLVKPYSWLGAVPWELHVQPELAMPMLRLPGWLPDPDRSTSTFNVALCATAPAEDGTSTATTMGPDVVRAIVDGVGTKLRLHIFADDEARPVLRSAVGNLRGVEIHEPDLGIAELTDASTPYGPHNVWLHWIQRTMQGRTLDAVHFITHGFALGSDGAILTTLSPVSSDRERSAMIQSGELWTYLTQVGALNAIFSRPGNNYSDYALRRFVDELGSRRAGPVMLHDSRLDPDSDRLREGYAFLASNEPAQPPGSGSLVLFAQPHQVSVTSPGDDEMRRFVNVPASSPAVKEHFSREVTPVWVSAAQRYIEDYEAELIRFNQEKFLRTPTNSEVAYYEGVESALRKIRGVIDEHAEGQL